MRGARQAGAAGSGQAAGKQHEGRRSDEAETPEASCLLDRSPHKSPLSHRDDLKIELFGDNNVQCNCQRGQVPWYEDTPGVCSPVERGRQRSCTQLLAGGVSTATLNLLAL